MLYLQKETAVHALTIDKAADLPIMFYNYPARMGVTMGKRILRHGFAESALSVKKVQVI